MTSTTVVTLFLPDGAMIFQHNYFVFEEHLAMKLAH